MDTKIYRLRWGSINGALLPWWWMPRLVPIPHCFECPPDKEILPNLSPTQRSSPKHLDRKQQQKRNGSLPPPLLQLTTV